MAAAHGWEGTSGTAASPPTLLFFGRWRRSLPTHGQRLYPRTAPFGLLCYFLVFFVTYLSGIFLFFLHIFLVFSFLKNY